MIKAGDDDRLTPNNCKTGIHCVFHMQQPHGNVYAAVSKTLAEKNGKELYIPHIIKKITPTENFRKKYNIPKDALVIGRHGGKDSFDLQFVWQAVAEIVNERKDVYFLFLSTNTFFQHERIIHIPWIPEEEGVFNFIDTCDVMLHGRYMGETFGLAVAEFAISNKPVITWTGMLQGVKQNIYDTAHIENLKGKAILYNDNVDLKQILLNLDVNYLRNNNWDTISGTYGETKVMEQYNKVFLQ
jgi:glycosyltransferase involved in cell wall biosynthesis